MMNFMKVALVCAVLASASMQEVDAGKVFDGSRFLQQAEGRQLSGMGWFDDFAEWASGHWDNLTDAWDSFKDDVAAKIAAMWNHAKEVLDEHREDMDKMTLHFENGLPNKFEVEWTEDDSGLLAAHIEWNAALQLEEVGVDFDNEGEGHRV